MLSKISEFNNQDEFFVLCEDFNLHFGSFARKTQCRELNDIDLMIIPGVCFDREKNRLGFGKGYYDRYLNNNVKKMAICFEKQVLDKELLPVDRYDKKMDIIITDKNIY